MKKKTVKESLEITELCSPDWISIPKNCWASLFKLGVAPFTTVRNTLYLKSSKVSFEKFRIEQKYVYFDVSRILDFGCLIISTSKSWPNPWPTKIRPRKIAATSWQTIPSSLAVSDLLNNYPRCNTKRKYYHFSNCVAVFRKTVFYNQWPHPQEQQICHKHILHAGLQWTL